MSKYLIFIFFTIIFITGCSFSNNLETTLIKMKNFHLFTHKPKNILLNFDAALDNIISDLLKSNNVFISNNTLFFIDILKNNSNSILDTKKLTDLIKNKIAKKTNNVYFFETQIIDENKKKLGLSNIQDSIDTGTALLLSRNNNVKYYLNSCLSEEKKKFSLKIQLILVRTGEIVFVKTEKFYF